jgi:hypothetical protein
LLAWSSASDKDVQALHLIGRVSKRKRAVQHGGGPHPAGPSVEREQAKLTKKMHKHSKKK